MNNNSEQENQTVITNGEIGVRANKNGSLGTASPAIMEKEEKSRTGIEFPVIEPWPEPVKAAELLAEIEALLKRFVVLPKWAGETLALWILHTYAFELRDVSTYLGIESPEKRCGKTTLLTLLIELANRPIVAANISSPAFFRVIEQIRPTLLIDEADTFLQGNDELRGILNSGYTKKTAYVVRVFNQYSDDGYRKFSCWCPKVIATIGRLPDTLADRCIVLRMHRKTMQEACDRMRDVDTMDIKRKCVRLVADHASQIAKARPRIPEVLNDRAGDIWEPLLALADIAGGDWPVKARQAAEGLTITAHETNPIAALLLDIFCTLATAPGNRIFTRNLLWELNRFESRPWSEARNGKPITDIWLAQQLRPYGIRSRTIWIDGKQGKGFIMDEMTEAFRRYIPRADVEALREEFKRERPEGTDIAKNPAVLSTAFTQRGRSTNADEQKA